MDQQLAQRDQKIGDLSLQIKEMADHSYQWEKHADELEDTINELMATNDQKNRQLSACIQDLENEKKSKMDAIKKFSKALAACEEDEEKLEDEIRRLNDELKAAQELADAAVKRRDEAEIKEQAKQQLLDEQKKFNDDLKKENSAIVKQMNIKIETFEAEMTALKKSKNYHKSSADKNVSLESWDHLRPLFRPFKLFIYDIQKQRRVFDEYVITKKAEIEAKNIKRIGDNERTASRSAFDRLREKLIDVLDQTKKELDKSNDDNMAKVIREITKQENDVIENGQKLLKENSEGKSESSLVFFD